MTIETVYISAKMMNFKDLAYTYVYGFPPEVYWWVGENIKNPLWDIESNSGRHRGILLSEDDAIIFKLKFGDVI